MNHKKKWKHFIVNLEFPERGGPFSKLAEAVAGELVPKSVQRFIFLEIAHREKEAGQDG